MDWRTNMHANVLLTVCEECLQILIIPGHWSENRLHAWLFHNPCGQVLKSIKSRKKRYISTGIGEQPGIKMDFRKFSRNNAYINTPGKLSEIHLHAGLFFNPCGKVLSIVGISWSPDLRVQHMSSFQVILKSKSNVSILQYFAIKAISNQKIVQTEIVTSIVKKIETNTFKGL